MKIINYFVFGAGIEPARANAHKILSLACLPIPPPEHTLLFCGPCENRTRGTTVTGWYVSHYTNGPNLSVFPDRHL